MKIYYHLDNSDLHFIRLVVRESTASRKSMSLMRERKIQRFNFSSKKFD